MTVGEDGDEGHAAERGQPEYEEDEGRLGDPGATGKQREMGVERLVTAQKQQRDREHAAHAGPGEDAGKRQALGGGLAGNARDGSPDPDGVDRCEHGEQEEHGAPAERRGERCRCGDAEGERHGDSREHDGDRAAAAFGRREAGRSRSEHRPQDTAERAGEQSAGEGEHVAGRHRRHRVQEREAGEHRAQDGTARQAPQQRRKRDRAERRGHSVATHEDADMAHGDAEGGTHPGEQAPGREVSHDVDERRGGQGEQPGPRQPERPGTTAVYGVWDDGSRGHLAIVQP